MKNPLLYPAMGLIYIYKWTLSPAFDALGVRCRHYPGCSSYGLDAFRTHGVWRGFWLTLSRVSRCHPWGSHGIDPVPSSLEKPPFWAPWRYGDWAWSERPAKDTSPKDTSPKDTSPKDTSPKDTALKGASADLCDNHQHTHQQNPKS